MTKGKVVKLSKRGWAENVSIQHLLNVLNSDPKENANAADKLENGKPRAFFAVVAEHYVLSTYANFRFEERLRAIPSLKKGATGIRATQQVMRHAAITRDQTFIARCLII